MRKVVSCPLCGGPMWDGRAMCPVCSAHRREAEQLGRCPGQGRKPLPVHNGRCGICGKEREQ